VVKNPSAAKLLAFSVPAEGLLPALLGLPASSLAWLAPLSHRDPPRYSDGGFATHNVHPAVSYGPVFDALL